MCAYKCGETPNPCVDCNRYIKWGLLFEKCEELSCDKIVTGHYAQVVYDENKDKWIPAFLYSKRNFSEILSIINEYNLDHAMIIFRTCMDIGDTDAWEIIKNESIE